MELELNRTYEIPKNDYSYIEKRHKLMLKAKLDRTCNKSSHGWIHI